MWCLWLWSRRRSRDSVWTGRTAYHIKKQRKKLHRHKLKGPWGKQTRTQEKNQHEDPMWEKPSAENEDTQNQHYQRMRTVVDSFLELLWVSRFTCSQVLLNKSSHSSWHKQASFPLFFQMWSSTCCCHNTSESVSGHMSSSSSTAVAGTQCLGLSTLDQRMAGSRTEGCLCTFRSW